jgi:hypothetical protein
VIMKLIDTMFDLEYDINKIKVFKGGVYGWEKIQF